MLFMILFQKNLSNYPPKNNKDDMQTKETCIHGMVSSHCDYFFFLFLPGHLSK